MEDEQVKNCMKRWQKSLDITLDQWENMQKKGLKFTLNYNFKNIFSKMMYCCYLTQDKLSKMNDFDISRRHIHPLTFLIS